MNRRIRATLSGMPADACRFDGYWNGWASLTFTAEQAEAFVALVTLHRLAGWDGEGWGHEETGEWSPWEMFHPNTDGTYSDVGGLTWEAEGFTHGTGEFLHIY